MRCINGHSVEGDGIEIRSDTHGVRCRWCHREYWRRLSSLRDKPKLTDPIKRKRKNQCSPTARDRLLGGLAISIAAESYEVPVEYMLSTHRWSEITSARWAAAFILRDASIPYMRIGAILNRNHASIIYGLKHFQPDKTAYRALDCWRATVARIDMSDMLPRETSAAEMVG